MIMTESRLWLGRFLRFAVSTSLIAWLLRRADLGSIADVLRNADALLLASAFATFFVGYAVIAFHFLVQIALDVGWLLSKKELPANYIAEASAH